MKAVVVIEKANCPKCNQIINITEDTVLPNDNQKENKYVLRCSNCNTCSTLDVQVKPVKQRALSELKHERAMAIIKDNEPKQETKKGIFKWQEKTTTT